MRRRLLILACAVIFASECPSIEAQSLNDETPKAVSKNLCTEHRIICVSKSVTNYIVNNPFKIDVQVNSADDIYVAWQIQDSTGQILESSSTYDYTDQPTENFTPGRILHVQAFIFTPSRSGRGTLTLTPSRYTIQTGGVDLPGITVPIRLTTAKSTVTILEPEKPAELQGAASDWEDSEDQSEFDPKIKLRTRQLEIMQFDRAATVGATVEAVLRSWPGQSQWHVTHWRQSGSIVHVAVIGGGWAGVSFYGAEVSFLIEKSILHLPGITRLILE